ncbi:MAG: hypothetical protein IKS64_07615 [Muribaculaceae bacterium]|nr:hypothetical protein [Muribaculaceae bacterium]
MPQNQEINKKNTINYLKVLFFGIATGQKPKRVVSLPIAEMKQVIGVK